MGGFEWLLMSMPLLFLSAPIGGAICNHYRWGNGIEKLNPVIKYPIYSLIGLFGWPIGGIIFMAGIAMSIFNIGKSREVNDKSSHTSTDMSDGGD
jgi:hypothetical protein